MNLQQLNLKVMKADYHGSILRVWRSKCPSYVGIEGILLQETQNTLQLIPKDNRIRSEGRCLMLGVFNAKPLPMPLPLPLPPPSF